MTQATPKDSKTPTHWIDLDELLHRIDLPALVEAGGTHLEYKRGRGEYRGTCPFHHGDNPTSFQIFQVEDGHWGWKCWSCGKGGNAIGFVQESENISDFLEAVRWLVDWARISPEVIGLTPEAEKQVQERKARTDVFDLVARFAVERLWSEAGKEALAYARSRSFSDDLIRLAGFGFLDGSTQLRDYLEQAGADMHLAHKLGLIRADGRDFTANSEAIRLLQRVG
jgi:DNA primase